MTTKELKEVLLSGASVMYDGTEYQKVIRISFELKEKILISTATLLDKCGRSEITVLGKDVQLCTQ